MDLRLLELFVAVAEEGSIHGGARRLLIAQPAVSKGLQRLERQVATALVVRSPQGIELTPAGEVMLSESREILERIGRAVAAVRDRGRHERTLTVGLIAGTVAAGDLTKHIVQSYRRRHPDVALSLRELTFPEQFEALASGDVDVALLRPPCEDDRLDLDVLFDEPLVLCCGSEHKLAEAGTEGLEVDDVLDEPMLDMAGAPREWTDFWHLSDYRGGPARVAADPAATLSELGLAVAFGEVVTPVAASAWRLGLSGAGISAVPLRDSPRSKVAVASRDQDARTDVAEFRRCARDVTEALIDVVPDAVLR